MKQQSLLLGLLLLYSAGGLCTLLLGATILGKVISFMESLLLGLLLLYSAGGLCTLLLGATTLGKVISFMDSVVRAARMVSARVCTHEHLCGRKSVLVAPLPSGSDCLWARVSARVQEVAVQAVRGAECRAFWVCFPG